MISHKKIGAFTFIAQNDESPRFLGFINANNFALIRLHDDISKATKLDLIFKPVLQYINENKLLTRGALYTTSAGNGNVQYYMRDGE